LKNLDLELSCHAPGVIAKSSDRNFYESINDFARHLPVKGGALAPDAALRLPRRFSLTGPAFGTYYIIIADERKSGFWGRARNEITFYKTIDHALERGCV